MHYAQLGIILGEKLSDEAGGDIKVFFANLRLKQEKYAERHAEKIPLKIRTIRHEANTLAV